MLGLSWVIICIGLGGVHRDGRAIGHIDDRTTGHTFVVTTTDDITNLAV